jgi:hypothetical protein
MIAIIECEFCDGHGGGCGYWGEWDDCFACEGEGKLVAERLSYIWHVQDSLDKEIDRLIREEEGESANA